MTSTRNIGTEWNAKVPKIGIRSNLVSSRPGHVTPLKYHFSMRLYQDLLSHIFGLKVQKRLVNRAIALILAMAAIFTPLNFAHAILDYGHRRIATEVKWVFGSISRRVESDQSKQLNAIGNRNEVARRSLRPGKT